MAAFDNAARHAGAQHRVHGLLPQRALSKRCLVVRHVIGRGAHDAVALIAVAQAQRDDLRHQRVLLQSLHFLQGDVASGYINMENARQDELQRAALGAHYQVDAAQITLKRLVELRGDQQHQGDGGQAERQHQQVQHRGQRAGPQVAPRQAGEFEDS
ncbi:hypothetical protein QF021_001493 [Acidovorax delafieldii]|nr:hypothetical protein [Acidovorax delafieldii]